MAANKGRKRRFVIVVAVLLLAALGVGVYFIANPFTGRMKSAAMESVMEVSGVIIRQETVTQRGDAYHIHYLVNDGDFVQSNQPIATIYERGYDDYLNNMVALEQQIYQQQLALLRVQLGQDNLPANLVQINNDINTLVDAIADVSSGESQQSFLTLQQQLGELLANRRAIMEQLVVADDALIANINSLRAMEAAFNLKSTMVNLGSAGYISFNLDGYENALMPDLLNTTQISDLLSSNGRISASNADLYRIAAADYWYVAFNAPLDSAERLIEGQVYTLTPKGSDVSYNAYCKTVRTFTSRIMFVLEINADVAPVLNMRTGEFLINRSAIGVSVPLTALTYNEGVPIVLVKQGDDYVEIPVYVMCSDEKNAIVLAQDSNIQLREGLRYKMP